MYSKLDGQIVKIWQAKPADKFTNQPSGTIIAIDNGYISVACGHSTVLNITELQLAGKTRQLARQFILGRANLLGQVFHQE